MLNSQVGVFNLGAPDPIAERKKVWFRPSSSTDTVRVGDLVCYNSDLAADWKERTTNRSPGGALDATTYAEGNQTYNARLFVVEKPASANLDAFAGVVAELGPEAGEDGDLIEIWIPKEGAVVPVMCDMACTINSTVIGVVNAKYEGSVGGRAIGVAAETVDRSSTDGLVWMRMKPGMCIYQKANDTALSYDDEDPTATIIANHVYITEAQTAGSFVPFMVQHIHTGNASASLHTYGILDYVDLQGTYDQAGYNRVILAQLNLSGTLNSGGAHFYSMYAQLTGTPTATEVGHVAAIGIDCNLGVNPTTGNYTGILIANNGANQTEVDSAITIYGNYGINYLFDFESCDGLTANFISDLGTGADKVITTGTGGNTYKVKVNYGGTDAYLILYEDPTEAAN